MKGPSDFLSRIAYVGDRHEVLCSERASACWTIETDTGVSALSFSESFPWKWGVLTWSISPDGLLLALALRDGTIVLWHRPNQQEVLRFPAHEIVREEPDAIYGVAWLPDGKGLVTVGTDRVGSARVRQGLIKVWHVN